VKEKNIKKNTSVKGEREREREREKRDIQQPTTPTHAPNKVK
jgi:hypothetical protein